MRKVFIDAGANVGQSIEAFCNHYPNAEEFEIHSFEPSQDDINILKPLNAMADKLRSKVKNIEVYNKAIWTHNGKVNFYDSGDESSSIANISRPFAVEEHQIEVECVDISSWIKNNFSKEDHIVLKLDIEGGEYDVIPKMFEDGALEYVDKLFCEVHGIKCRCTFDQSMSLLNIAEEAVGGLYVWGAKAYGTREDSKYDEEVLKREYKKWHINDIECAYLRGDMSSIDDITENDIINMINIMVENKIWKAKIKGTRYVMDLSEAQTLLHVH